MKTTEDKTKTQGDPEACSSTPKGKELAIFGEVEILTIQATAFQTKAEAMVVESDEHVTGATNLLSYIAQSKKSFEDRRTGIVKPLNDDVKKVNDAFKKIEAPLDTATKVLKDKVINYRQEQEKKRQAELARVERDRKVAEDRQKELEAARLQELLTTGVIPEKITPVQPVAPVELPPEIPTKVNASLGSSTVRKVWDFEIVDPALVPRLYLTVEEKLIREAIKAGVREITGVRIFQKDQLSISTR
jgi:hypothetical protein